MKPTYLVLSILVFLCCCPTWAGITPGDVVVVYNNSTLEENDYDWTVSKRVADYYCAARGIPVTNQCGVTWAYGDDTMSPARFVADIQTPLKQFLDSPQFRDPNHPDADPIKAIVLCYGVPMVIAGGERVGAVDSTLSLLFNTTPWGAEPIGGCAAGYSVGNPYYEAPPESIDCLQRTKIRDFAEFKGSTENDWNRESKEVLDRTKKAQYNIQGSW